MDTNLHPREPKGQPTGGQFTSKANPEAEIELGVVSCCHTTTT
ncbi:MAG: hypothetical protein ACYCV7_04135 [Acidimicrobiales bacterium]